MSWQDLSHEEKLEKGIAHYGFMREGGLLVKRSKLTQEVALNEIEAVKGYKAWKIEPFAPTAPPEQPVGNFADPDWLTSEMAEKLNEALEFMGTDREGDELVRREVLTDELAQVLIKGYETHCHILENGRSPYTCPVLRHEERERYGKRIRAIAAATEYFMPLIGGGRVIPEHVPPQVARWLVAEHHKHKGRGDIETWPPAFIEKLRAALEHLRIPEPAPQKRSWFEKLKRRFGRKGS